MSLRKQLELGDLYLRTWTAEKRWGHGRTIQLAARVFCHVFGHAWLRWRWEWSDEEMTEMDFVNGSPPPNVVLTWFRGCDRDCGIIQSIEARYDQKEQLPS